MQPSNNQIINNESSPQIINNISSVTNVNNTSSTDTLNLTQTDKSETTIPSMITTSAATTTSTDMDMDMDIDEDEDEKVEKIPSMISLNIPTNTKKSAKTIPLPSLLAPATEIVEEEPSLPSMIPQSLSKVVYSSKTLPDAPIIPQILPSTKITPPPPPPPPIVTPVKSPTPIVTPPIISQPILPKNIKNQQQTYLKNIIRNAVEHSTINIKKSKNDKNFAKWSKRENEIEKVNFATTTEPICKICKRKFKSKLLLTRHENESELHKVYIY